MKIKNICFILMTALFFTGCSGEEKKVKKEIIRPVKYIKVFSYSGDTSRRFSGVSQAGKVSKVSFRVGGKLEKLKFQDGDEVAKGSLIAVLDDSDAKLKYEKTQASLNKSKVYRDSAKSNLNRVKKLYENGNISLKDYEAAKDNYANANATWLADKRSTELLKKELGYYSLYSDSSGVVSGKAVEEGENISTGQVILEIHSLDKMEINAGIPETYIAEVKKGEIAVIEFNTIKNKIFQGKITEVSYNIDSDSSTYPVTIEIIHPSSEIRPGMPADAIFTFKGKERSHSLLVPVHAVGEDTEGNFVFIVNKKEKGFGIVEKKRVEVGEMMDSGFEIKKGVKDGDLVVTAGISKLSNGLKVRLR